MPTKPEILRIILAIVTGCFLIWCIVSFRNDIADVSFQSARRAWSLLPVLLTFSLLNYTVRALRWQWYLSKLGHHLSHGYAALTYVAAFAFMLSPGKLGELMRYRYYDGISIGTLAAVLFVERLIDLFAVLALASFVLIANPSYNFYILSTSIVISVSFVLLIFLPWRRIFIRLTAARGKPSAIARLSVAAANAATEVRPLLSSLPVLIGFLTSIGAWGLEGVGFGMLSHAIEPSDMSIVAAVGIYATATIVGTLSFVPGGLGGTEAVMTSLLAAQSYAISDALLITIICRIVTLWFAVGLGWASVLVLKRLRAKDVGH